MLEVVTFGLVYTNMICIIAVKVLRAGLQTFALFKMAIEEFWACIETCTFVVVPFLWVGGLSTVSNTELFVGVLSNLVTFFFIDAFSRVVFSKVVLRTVLNTFASKSITKECDWAFLYTTLIMDKSIEVIPTLILTYTERILSSFIDIFAFEITDIYIDTNVFFSISVEPSWAV